MSFRKEVRESLSRLEEKMDRLLRLYGNTEGLRDQNEALFDKLIAKDWSEYMDSPSVEKRASKPPSTEMVMSPSQDESSIGEILSDEELTGQ